MPTANEPSGHASINIDDMDLLAKGLRKAAVDDAALRVLAAVVGSKAQVCQAPPGVLPPDRLFVIFAVPEVMARLRELTKGA
jgi:hypothetical protein